MVFYGNQWKNAKNIKKLTIFLPEYFFCFKNSKLLNNKGVDNFLSILYKRVDKNDCVIYKQNK